MTQAPNNLVSEQYRETAPSFVATLIQHWPRKLFWTIVFPSVFLLLYFGTQNTYWMPPISVPSTAIDQWVAFDPRWTLVYASLWLFLPIGPWMLCTKAEIRRYLLGYGVIWAVAFPVFLFWPVESPRPEQVPDHLAYSLLVSVDGLRNCFPSLHAANGVYSLFIIYEASKQAMGRSARRAVTAVCAIWLVLILYSVLATKQHWFIDVLAGVPLGAMGYWLVWKRLKHKILGDEICE